MAPTPQRDATLRLSAIPLDLFELAELELADSPRIQAMLDASAVPQNNGDGDGDGGGQGDGGGSDDGAGSGAAGDGGSGGDGSGSSGGDAGEDGLSDSVKAILKKNRDAAAAAQRELAKAQGELKKLQDRDKSELERAQDAKVTAEKAAADASAELLRIKVATAKGIPLDLAARLQGASEDELSADADRLMPLLKPAGSETGTDDKGTGGSTGKGGGTFDGGSRGNGDAKRYSREQIEAMSPAEINANWADVQASLKQTTS